MTGPTCQRCRRPATGAVAVEEGVLLLCRRHARERAERLAADPRVKVGRREVVVEAPALEVRP